MIWCFLTIIYQKELNQLIQTKLYSYSPNFALGCSSFFTWMVVLVPTSLSSSYFCKIFYWYIPQIPSCQFFVRFLKLTLHKFFSMRPLLLSKPFSIKPLPPGIYIFNISVNYSIKLSEKLIFRKMDWKNKQDFIKKLKYEMVYQSVSL